MFENKLLRLESGKSFHLKFEDNALVVNYTADNSAKKLIITLTDFTVTRLGTVAYCDEAVELSQATLYRLRDKLIIK